MDTCEKTCSTCKQTKKAEEFYLNYRNKDGLKSLCKVCESEAKKRCYRKYRDKVLEKNDSLDWNN